MGLVTGVTLPNNGDRIKAENYNDPITKIIAQVNGGLDSSNVTAGTLPWSVMSSFTNSIPAAAMQDEGNLKKFRDEANISFVVTGLVWSATSGLDGAMTSGTIYTPDGTRAAVSAIATKTFTASRDTYVDVSPAGVVGYSDVANGATPPALTTDYTRIAIVVTNGSAITAIHGTAKRQLDSWTELGRVTLGLAGDSLKCAGLLPKKNLRIIMNLLATGGTTTAEMTFNGDTGNNYSRQSIINGAAPADAVSQPSLGLAGGASSEDKYINIELSNLTASEKLGRSMNVESGGAGAAAAPDHSIQDIKWANTSAQINRVDVVNNGAGDFAVGSEIIVYGRD